MGRRAFPIRSWSGSVECATGFRRPHQVHLTPQGTEEPQARDKIRAMLARVTPRFGDGATLVHRSGEPDLGKSEGSFHQ
jgi:hypothetical protein